MNTIFPKFIGKNWFENREAIDTAAAKVGLHTCLKVKDDKVHNSHIDLIDVDNIDVEEDRLTITILPCGTIVTIRQG